MAGLLTIITNRLQPAFDAVVPGADPVVRPSTRPGVDVQVNGALPLARRVGAAPAELAEKIVGTADLADVCSRVEVAPQGFVNLTLAAPWLAERVREQVGDPRLGRSAAAQARRVVVDYSAPNIAKELHVGILRTTIIGDALCRLLADAGHDVIRENHVGDWGTPFGMLIEHLVEEGEERTIQTLSVGDLKDFYQDARARFDASEEFRERSRARVVALQAGDPETLRLWRILVDESVRYFSQLYARLGVLLQPEDVVGESFYNNQLASLVDELDAKGLLVESEGARCVFPPGFTNREGEPLPVIVQKSDGGYGYAATDLAALRDRFGRLGADLALYVVGAPQAQHFAMVFAVAHAAGWIPEGAEAVHIAFGNMLGPDRRMFRTRSGEAVAFTDLVDEAEQRGRDAVAEKSPGLPAGEQEVVAHAVGIGALKYADLSTDRLRDYVFDWDRMLAFEGNTAPYLQYAHARIHSIFRRADLAPATYRADAVAPSVTEPAERELAIALLGFDTAVEATLETYSPHKLCAYLFELAGAFTTFYETCPVLRAEGDVRDGRLVLCAATAAVLEAGLGLLGIDAPVRM